MKYEEFAPDRSPEPMLTLIFTLLFGGLILGLMAVVLKLWMKLRRLKAGGVHPAPSLAERPQTVSSELPHNETDRSRIEAQKRPEPQNLALQISGLPLTIGEAQPSADEEPHLQMSSALPSDLLVHGGSVLRHGRSMSVMRACSLRGVASRLQGKERQDAYGFATGEQSLVIAVADGVGSAPNSGTAARLASRNVCIRFQAAEESNGPLHDEAIQAIFENCAWETVLAAREHASDENLSAQAAARSMATTLVVASIRQGRGDSYGLTLARVGDSSAWLIRLDDARPLFESDLMADDSVLVDTKTAALPGLGASGAEVYHCQLQRGDVLILASDGFATAWGTGTSDVADYFRRAWQRPPDQFTFAHQVGFRRRSFDDDRTVIAVWI